MSGNQENPDDLPASTIIIVACVCGVVVIALTIVLIVLCCRRKQSRRKFEEDQQKRTQPSSQQQPHANGGLKSAIKGSGGAGYENPAVDGNTIDFDDGSNTGVFATNTSQNAGHYDPYAQHRHLNGNHHGHHNGHVGNGYIPRGNEPPPAYDSQFDNPYVPVNKKKLPEKTYLSDDPYIPKHETSKESHSSDSGVSTPDPVSTKKKVIHEVIV